MPIDLSVAQTAAPSPSVLLALGQGLLSFISPCVLPLLPVYFAVLLGSGGTRKTREIVMRMLGFALGFISFYLLIGAGAGALGGVLAGVSHKTLNLVCGALFVVFGLMLTDLIPGVHLFQVNADASKFAGGGFFSMLAFGLVLALSWTPCTTAFLSSVIAMAASAQNATMLSGMGLLAVYALGMMIPFLLFMALSARLGGTVAFLKRHQLLIRRLGGGLLIVMGVLKMFNLF